MINSANEVSQCGLGTFALNHLNDQSHVSAIDLPRLLVELKFIARDKKRKKKNSPRNN